jgi:hypothetical protein
MLDPPQVVWAARAVELDNFVGFNPFFLAQLYKTRIRKSLPDVARELIQLFVDHPVGLDDGSDPRLM